MAAIHIERFPRDTTSPIAVMAFDFGTQRIGVAAGQSLSGTATRVTVLKARDGIPDWDQIAGLIGEWRPDAFVVGLPYNLDGTESEILPRAIKFANRLNGRFKLPVFGIDERLSTRAARDQIAAADGMKNRAAVDDLAAQIILENWFSEFRSLR